MRRHHPKRPRALRDQLSRSRSLPERLRTLTAEAYGRAQGLLVGSFVPACPVPDHGLVPLSDVRLVTLAIGDRLPDVDTTARTLDCLKLPRLYASEGLEPAVRKRVLGPPRRAAVMVVRRYRVAYGALVLDASQREDLDGAGAWDLAQESVRDRAARDGAALFLAALEAAERPPAERPGPGDFAQELPGLYVAARGPAPAGAVDLGRGMHAAPLAPGECRPLRDLMAYVEPTGRTTTAPHAVLVAFGLLPDEPFDVYAARTDDRAQAEFVERVLVPEFSRRHPGAPARPLERALVRALRDRMGGAARGHSDDALVEALGLAHRPFVFEPGAPPVFTMWEPTGRPEARVLAVAGLTADLSDTPRRRADLILGREAGDGVWAEATRRLVAAQRRRRLEAEAEVVVDLEE